MQILRNREWQYFAGGLNDLTGGKVGSKLSSLLMSQFRIERIERKGIFHGDDLLGTIALITQKGQDKADFNLINTFLNQVSIGIESVNLRYNLRKSKDFP